jgi:hypothetical protein
VTGRVESESVAGSVTRTRTPSQTRSPSQPQWRQSGSQAQACLGLGSWSDIIMMMIARATVFSYSAAGGPCARRASHWQRTVTSHTKFQIYDTPRFSGRAGPPGLSPRPRPGASLSRGRAPRPRHPRPPTPSPAESLPVALACWPPPRAGRPLFNLKPRLARPPRGGPARRSRVTEWRPRAGQH